MVPAITYHCNAVPVEKGGGGGVGALNFFNSCMRIIHINLQLQFCQTYKGG